MTNYDLACAAGELVRLHLIPALELINQLVCFHVVLNKTDNCMEEVCLESPDIKQTRSYFKSLTMRCADGKLEMIEYILIRHRTWAMSKHGSCWTEYLQTYKLCLYKQQPGMMPTFVAHPPDPTFNVTFDVIPLSDKILEVQVPFQCMDLPCPVDKKSERGIRQWTEHQRNLAKSRKTFHRFEEFKEVVSHLFVVMSLLFNMI